MRLAVNVVYLALPSFPLIGLEKTYAKLCPIQRNVNLP